LSQTHLSNAQKFYSAANYTEGSIVIPNKSVHSEDRCTDLNEACVYTNFSIQYRTSTDFPIKLPEPQCVYDE